MTWRRSVVAADGTHHRVDGREMYAARFHRVHEYHEPGLAPVVDASGAFHIAADGTAAYEARFLQTWGFYEGRAAVQDERGWLHILMDGRELSCDRFGWCGNFQSGRCTVRSHSGQYFHITELGEPAYAERYLYVGDFRDGSAVVRSCDRALCTHIAPDGRLSHGRWFHDLDVFHKGYARARDTDGWFHVSTDGSPAYSRRFVEVEPFYNGTAMACTQGGQRVLIGIDGRDVVVIAPVVPCRDERGIGFAVVVIGNIGAGKTAVAQPLAAQLEAPLVAIDELRSRHGDGSPAGELRAWTQFMESAQSADAKVLECSGSGPLTYLLAKALTDSRLPVVVLWVDTPVDVCLARIRDRVSDIPYPDFGVAIESVVRDLGRRLASELGRGKAWARFPVHRINGDMAREGVLDHAWQQVRAMVRGSKL